MNNPSEHSNSAGVAQSDDAWLDARFQSRKTEYEGALHSIGIQSGWRVLDAGCGAGGFLPLLCELVGPGGHVHAMDVAPDVIDRVNRRASLQRWPAPDTARVGSLTALPYDTGSMDAVWCANVLQYLSDADLNIALQEFMRVLRPGRVLGIKDYDATGASTYPGFATGGEGVYSFLKTFEHAQLRGIFRTFALSAWLRRTGFVKLSERYLPMVQLYPNPKVVGDTFCAGFKYFADVLRDAGAPANCVEIQYKLADRDAPDHPFNSPDCVLREMQIVFVGHKPEAP